MVTCKIDTANVNRFSRIESLPTRTVFSDTHFNYDEGFWGDFNVILPEDKLNEAISRNHTQKIQKKRTTNRLENQKESPFFAQGLVFIGF